MFQRCHRVIQLSYSMMSSPFHLFPEIQRLTQILNYLCVCFLEFGQLLLRSGSIGLCIYGILLGLFGSDLKLERSG
jgi:hypothetical protein